MVAERTQKMESCANRHRFAALALGPRLEYDLPGLCAFTFVIFPAMFTPPYALEFFSAGPAVFAPVTLAVGWEGFAASLTVHCFLLLS